MKTGKRIFLFIGIVLAIFALAVTTYPTVIDDITLGLDLQGGYEILYKVVPSKEGQEVTRDLLIQTQAALQKRIDVIGVTEPEIRIEGDDRVRVKLAGVTDQEQARRMLATEAHLSFRDVDDELVMGGDNIVEGSAKVYMDKANKPYVAVQFKDENVTREATTKLYQQPMVIWLDWEEGDSYYEEAQKLDHKFISAPIVQNVLSSDGQITGSYTYNEAKELADLLNAGALPVTLDELSANGVSAKLGEQAMDLAIKAGYIGGLLIIIFMIAYYRLPGVVASVALVAYVYLILLVFNLLQATLTLPGIAALVLGVGTAVDANILTYERIKEEIRVGKSIPSAFKVGSKRALGTIIDANITSAITAAVLFYFGSSAIQGFAVMSMIAIVLSIITAVFGSRFLLYLLVSSNLLNDKPHWFGVKKEHIQDINLSHQNEIKAGGWLANVDFVKHHRKYFVVSGIVIVLGIVLFVVSGLNLGVDFTGGTQLEIINETASFTQEDVKGIEEVVNQAGLTAGDISFAGNNNEIARILFQENITKEQSHQLEQDFIQKYGDTTSMSETSVSADVARELVRQAIFAVLLACGGIMIYIAVRFELLFAISGVIALFHAPLLTIIAFSLLQLKVDLTFIAAILTVIGYSINDTVVIFDRIRENLRNAKIKTENDLSDIVNESIRGTMARSINTLLTVMFAVIALYIFGGEGIRNFSFALLIGLLAGAYSSLFIAAQLWLVLKKKFVK